MNAYELADEFKNRNWDEVDCFLWCEKSANMLRQQADLLKKYEKRNVELQAKITKLLAQTKPLSDEEILDITKDSTIFEYREFDDDMVRFARAIEERHGIK